MLSLLGGKSHRLQLSLEAVPQLLCFLQLALPACQLFFTADQPVLQLHRLPLCLSLDG